MMHVLVMNCGSSTLKFQLINTPKGDATPASECYLARGVIECKGRRGDRRGRNLAENMRSGLLGVSERSSDMRELCEAAGQGDAGAELAVVMFCYRVRKYIATYLAVLNGAD